MKNDQQYTANVISIHPVVWFSVTFFVSIFVGYSIIANWSNAPTIAHWVWIGIAVVLGIYLLHNFLRVLKYHHDSVHDVLIKKNDRIRSDEKVRQERAKTQTIEMLPTLVRYAIDNGHNVRYSGLEITNNLPSLSSVNSVTQSTLLPSANGSIPEPYRFGDVLHNWTPSKKGIFLGTGREIITVPTGEPLCHTALGGKTDSGKSNIQLLLMSQLLYLGETVYFCNPHYRQMWRDSNGEIYDIGLMEPHFAYPPISDPAMILRLIIYLQQELSNRKELARGGLVDFESIYLFMDELPALAYYIPDIMEYLGIFLRESRKYGIFFIGASQDFLNDTLASNNGAIRENFLTNYYGGGDDTTARILLDLAKGERIDQTGLGYKGLFYLLAKSISHDKTRVRVPLVDTESIRTLFGGRKVLGSGSPFEEYMQNQNLQNLQNLGDKRHRIAELRTQGSSQDEIILELWGVRKGGSSAYKKALAEYKEIINEKNMENT